MTRTPIRARRQQRPPLRPKTEAILHGLGFAQEDLDRPLRTFSGGWRMRVSLARLLLRQPGVLLLDEPTNHLDIESIAWLEEYLRSYPGAVVLVSHDRYFLDRMINRIAELYMGQGDRVPRQLLLLPRGARRAAAFPAAAYDNQQREIAQAERFVARFRARPRRPRRPRAGSSGSRRWSASLPPPPEDASIRFRFPEPPAPGAPSSSSRSSPRRIGGRRGPSRVPPRRPAGDRARRQDRAHRAQRRRQVHARSGCSTARAFDGERELGYAVTKAFFAQNQAEALPQASPCSTPSARPPTATPRPSSAPSSAPSSSGRRRVQARRRALRRRASRLALARTLLSPANFLLLDEPTNHLDMTSKAGARRGAAPVRRDVRRGQPRPSLPGPGRHAGLARRRGHRAHLPRALLGVPPPARGRAAGTHPTGQSRPAPLPAEAPAGASGDGAAKPPLAPTAAARAALPSSGPKSKEQKRREAEERNRLYRPSRKARTRTSSRTRSSSAAT
jgi:ATP-binding cassette, subfamily F, member 3